MLAEVVFPVAPVEQSGCDEVPGDPVELRLEQCRTALELSERQPVVVCAEGVEGRHHFPRTLVGSRAGTQCSTKRNQLLEVQVHGTHDDAMSDTTSETPEVVKASERLLKAAATGMACAPVRDLIGSNDLVAAYAVQARCTAARLAAGATVVGRKIGLTSKAVQAQIGVDQPDLGYLFDDMGYNEFDIVPMSRLLQPKAEAEVAFVLGEDLAEGDLDLARIRGAVDHLTAVIEIVDSRIAGWDITFGDTVADNGSSALYVLGSERRTLDEVEPVTVEMTMTRNGEHVSQGNGAACLDDPLNALWWLARTARDFGDPLRAGQVILSGALGPMVTVNPGDVVTATISGLGSVTATFSRAAGAPSLADKE